MEHIQPWGDTLMSDFRKRPVLPSFKAPRSPGSYLAPETALLCYPRNPLGTQRRGFCHEITITNINTNFLDLCIDRLENGMKLIDDFFDNYMGVRLNKPIRANLDMPSAPQPVEAIVMPRIDPHYGPAFDFYDVSDPRIPIVPFDGQIDQVIVTTRQGSSIETVLSGRFHVGIGQESRNTEGTLVVSQREFQRSDQAIALASFCIENFPRFLGSGAMKYVEIHPMMRGIGDVEIQADGWNITLTESTEDDPDFGISHAGVVRRQDRSTFSVGDLRHLVDGLTYFFSFAAGTYRTPVVIMARSEEHMRVWGQLGRFNQPPYRSGNWFRRHNGGDLAEVFPGFWDCFQSDEDKVKTIISQYCESSMIANIGLHKHALVTSRSALEGAAKWQLDRPSIRSIEVADALCCAGVTFHNDRLQRITDVRDQVSHSDFFTTDSQEFYDLWYLSQRYVERMLFKRFGYEPESVQEHETTG